MKSKRYCIICEKRAFRLIKSIGKYKIFECKNCELAYTDSSIVSVKGRQEQINILYNFSDYQKEEEKHSKKFIKVINLVKKSRKSGRLLDAGGGYGLFSKLMLENSKFYVEIIEPYLEPEYIKHKNIKIHRIKLENFLNTTKRKYDVIALLDVLEHFENPDEIIEGIKKILKDTGIAIISLPNYKSLMAGISKKWAWWMVEDHKYHFSPYSIDALMKKHNFLKKFATSYESSLDLKKNLDENFKVLPFPVKQLSKLVLLLPFMLIYNILKPILWYFDLGGLTIRSYMKNEKK